MSLLSCRLKALREEQGYSKTAVAMAVGVTRRAVYGWESGTMTPTIESIIQLAKFYQVSTDYLLGLTNERRPTQYV